MIVLDASAAIELVLATAIGARVANRVADPDDTLHAPHLIDLEVAQVLRRYVLAGAVAESRATAALTDFCDLGLARYPHDLLVPRIWQMRHNLSAYDAAYVALAETLDAVFVTTDARLARAPGHSVTVDVIGT